MRRRGNPPGTSDDLGSELAKSRELTARLRIERNVLRQQLKEVRAAEASMVAELQRLRELAFGDATREPPGAIPSYLFILSCGRTGSTLVQGVLNTAPGVLIRGENGGVLADLFRFHATAGFHRERLARDSTFLQSTNAWFGIDGYPEDLARRELRQLATDLLFRPGPDANTVGGKEIRWSGVDAHDYIRFLREVFPGARFILSSRRLEDVATSGWWSRRENAMAELTILDTTIRSAVQELGPVGFELRYEDFVDNPDGLQPMFEWLGLPFRPNVVAATMSRPHSYEPRATLQTPPG
jgi:hypothetical protein